MTQMYLGPKRVLVVSSPTVIDTLVKERPSVYKRPLDAERVFKASNINGLFSMEGKLLRRVHSSPIQLSTNKTPR